MRNDALERLELYPEIASECEATLRNVLGNEIENRSLWPRIKVVYRTRVGDRDDREIAETFFNSCTRRIFHTVGVDRNIEFIDEYPEEGSLPTAPSISRCYPLRTSVAAMIEAVLCDFDLGIEFRSVRSDSDRVASRIKDRLRALDFGPRIDQAEVLNSVFYRDQRAFLVGRLTCRNANGEKQVVPLVLALLHEASGPFVDAVLLDPNDVSIVFSFARAYFHVDAAPPSHVVRFLRTLVPRKSTGELYISIGRDKHGKTELYRSIIRYVDRTHERFEIARGQRGLVMIVFTMPGLPLVFKIIRDRFAHPKNTSRRSIMAKYRFVAQHDRAGRLIDAQEFEHLAFPANRFSRDLLTVLLNESAGSVSVDSHRATIKHCYVERKVTPLDLHLRESFPGSARAAVIDYGRCIKDLARAGIFPGDLLLKNFGVTRHGRVVFYDYDELTTMLECNFRKMPEPQTPEQELAAEPWFSVGPHDIFPEEFRAFLGLNKELRALFEREHADLFEAAFWTSIQERHERGEIVDIPPYPQDRRLRRRPD